MDKFSDQRRLLVRGLSVGLAAVPLLRTGVISAADMLHLAADDPTA